MHSPFAVLTEAPIGLGRTSLDARLSFVQLSFLPLIVNATFVRKGGHRPENCLKSAGIGVQFGHLYVGLSSLEGRVEPAADVTLLLNKLAAGDQEAASELIPLVYEELRRLASRHLAHERSDHTLQATALVHEAYVKLAAQKETKWQNRAQFFGVASQAMRRILVDYARGKRRIRRGGKQQKVSLDDVSLVSPDRSEEVLAVHESLSRLELLDARQARVVELRYFGGLTVEEIAEVVGISGRTVMRELNVAKAWLYGDLKDRSADEVPSDQK
jgi:RNA polymerase sigma-70 factor, ECF subfamily